MNNAGGIIILGLGPGGAELLTKQAEEILNSSSEIYLRTRNHPAVQGIAQQLTIHSFDDLYIQLPDFSEVYAEIIRQILILGQRPEGVVYAVPGHPFLAEATGPQIVKQAQQENIPVRVIPGLSFLEPVLTLLGIDFFPQTTLVDALEIASAHYPSFPPSAPALIAQLYSRQVASEVKLTLMAAYPDEHQVALVHAAGTDKQSVEWLPLYEIDRSSRIDLLTCLYIPRLHPAASLEAMAEVVAHLRAPDGCPWDKKQTLKSLRPHLLEEVYEVLTALDREDHEELREELGDLTLMVLMLTQIASESGEFNFSQVIENIHTKIVRRHPHVFADLEIEDEEGVLVNWEKLKEAERNRESAQENGLLAGIAKTSPALQQSQEIQARVSRVGFDWKDSSGVWVKVREELDELQKAESDEEREAEFGDILFALVNLARHLNLDAEAALRSTNSRFRKRFSYVETAVRQEGKNLVDMTLAEMDAYWEQAKAEDSSASS